MSFILDALRKLERTRTRGPAPTLDRSTFERNRTHAVPGSGRWPWLVGGAVVILGSGLLAWQFFQPKAGDLQSGAGGMRATQHSPRVVKRSAGSEVAPVAVLPKKAVPTVARVPTPIPAELAVVSKAAVEPQPRVVAPATIAPVASPVPDQQTSSTARIGAKPNEDRSVVAEREQQTVKRREVPAAYQGPSDVVPGRVGREPTTVAAEATPLPRRAVRNEQELSGDTDADLAQQVPLLEQMSPEIQNAVPKVKISILAYASTTADRMAYINGRKYVEGQLIDGKVKVEAIARSGVVLSYQGQRFLVKP